MRTRSEIVNCDTLKTSVNTWIFFAQWLTKKKLLKRNDNDMS